MWHVRIKASTIGELKVLFDHPNPFCLAHGGFQIQIEQTKQALGTVGCEVEWLRWWEPNQGADLIHYFGRPHPAYIRQCHEKGVKVVMSELLTGLGSRSAVKRLFQRWMTKAARITLPSDFTIRMGWESYQLADRVVALTTWEKHLMEEQFDAPTEKIVVVPNGVEDVFLAKSTLDQRESHLITTMTITERKRSVELVEAAALAKVKLRIFGAPYSPSDSYYLKFLSSLERAGTWVEYRGAVTDRKKIAEEYQKAAGFVLLSAMESQSLSALEAAACGCPLLLSDLPWAKVSFGGQASYAPVATPASTAPFLKDFVGRISEKPRIGNVMSWRAVAGELCEVYREAISLW